MCYRCSRRLVSFPEVAKLECKKGRQSSLKHYSAGQNNKSSQALTCTWLACYNCRMLQGSKTVRLLQFGVEFVLFAQQFVDRLVGFSDKYPVQITREKFVIVWEFEILVGRVLNWRF